MGSMQSRQAEESVPAGELQRATGGRGLGRSPGGNRWGGGRVRRPVGQRRGQEGRDGHGLCSRWRRSIDAPPARCARKGSRSWTVSWERERAPAPSCCLSPRADPESASVKPSANSYTLMVPASRNPTRQANFAAKNVPQPLECSKSRISTEPFPSRGRSKTTVTLGKMGQWISSIRFGTRKSVQI